LETSAVRFSLKENAVKRLFGVEHIGDGCDEAFEDASCLGLLYNEAVFLAYGCPEWG
jgi:hypothetical protein